MCYCTMTHTEFQICIENRNLIKIRTKRDPYRHMHKLGYVEKKKNLATRLKKTQYCVKKPGESNRDIFTALREGV